MNTFSVLGPRHRVGIPINKAGVGTKIHFHRNNTFYMLLRPQRKKKRSSSNELSAVKPGFAES